MSETNSAVAIMNQVPGSDAGVRGESPLHHVGLGNRQIQGALMLVLFLAKRAFWAILLCDVNLARH